MDEHRDHERSAECNKAPYQPPRLKQFGTLQQLTKTAEPEMAALDFAMFAYVESGG